jgi:hypothetical protein
VSELEHRQGQERVGVPRSPAHATGGYRERQAQQAEGRHFEIHGPAEVAAGHAEQGQVHEPRHRPSVLVDLRPQPRQGRRLGTWQVASHEAVVGERYVAAVCRHVAAGHEGCKGPHGRDEAAGGQPVGFHPLPCRARGRYEIPPGVRSPQWGPRTALHLLVEFPCRPSWIGKCHAASFSAEIVPPAPNPPVPARSWNRPSHGHRFAVRGPESGRPGSKCDAPVIGRRRGLRKTMALPATSGARIPWNACALRKKIPPKRY